MTGHCAPDTIWKQDLHWYTFMWALKLGFMPLCSACHLSAKWSMAKGKIWNTSRIPPKKCRYILLCRGVYPSATSHIFVLLEPPPSSIQQRLTFCLCDHRTHHEISDNKRNDAIVSVHSFGLVQRTAKNGNGTSRHFWLVVDGKWIFSTKYTILKILICCTFKKGSRFSNTLTPCLNHQSAWQIFFIFKFKLF